MDSDHFTYNFFFSLVHPFFSIKQYNSLKQ